MELLVHVNKRLKSRPKIQLPVKDLLDQYQDPNVQQFVTVSTFGYIIENIIQHHYRHHLPQEVTVLTTVIDHIGHNDI